MSLRSFLIVTSHAFLTFAVEPVGSKLSASSDLIGAHELQCALFLAVVTAFFAVPGLHRASVNPMDAAVELALGSKGLVQSLLQALEQVSSFAVGLGGARLLASKLDAASPAPPPAAQGLVHAGLAEFACSSALALAGMAGGEVIGPRAAALVPPWLVTGMKALEAGRHSGTVANPAASLALSLQPGTSRGEFVASLQEGIPWSVGPLAAALMAGLLVRIGRRQGKRAPAIEPSNEPKQKDK